MNFFGKNLLPNAQKTAQEIKHTLTRRWGGGFETIGHVKHPTDTRTIEQISDNIEAYAEKIPQVKNFIKDLRTLTPQHKALVSDVLERANETVFLMNDINMWKPVNGKSAVDVLLGDIIEASKTNPEALEFLQTVLNNTDTTAAKYALVEFCGGVLKNNNLSKQFGASKVIVPRIAEQTLSGGYLGTFEKEKSFMDFIKVLISPNSKPQNITLLENAQKMLEPIKNADSLYIDSFIRTDTPIEHLKDNINTLPQVAQLLKNVGKSLDSTAYLTKNVNLY